MTQVIWVHCRTAHPGSCHWRLQGITLKWKWVWYAIKALFYQVWLFYLLLRGREYLTHFRAQFLHFTGSSFPREGLEERVPLLFFTNSFPHLCSCVIWVTAGLQKPGIKKALLESKNNHTLPWACHLQYPGRWRHRASPVMFLVSLSILYKYLFWLILSGGLLQTLSWLVVTNLLTGSSAGTRLKAPSLACASCSIHLSPRAFCLCLHPLSVSLRSPRHRTIWLKMLG